MHDDLLVLGHERADEGGVRVSHSSCMFAFTLASHFSFQIAFFFLVFFFPFCFFLCPFCCFNLSILLNVRTNGMSGGFLFLLLFLSGKFDAPRTGVLGGGFCYDHH